MSKPRPGTITAIRDLDPASKTALSDAERERAAATLDRIVATPIDDRPTENSGQPRRRLARVLIPVGLVGAAAAVPVLLFGGGSAFASWTPTPEPLAAAAASEAQATCLDILGVTDQGERPLIAEQRGDWTYVVFAGPNSEGSCLMPEGLVGRRDPAADQKEGFMGSYSPGPGEAPTVARDSIAALASDSSVPTDGLWGFGKDEEWVTFVKGYAGSDVTGITVHAPTGVDVEASVANGRFAAWWPSVEPSSEHPEVMGAPTYTLTLTDGSTREVAG